MSETVKQKVERFLRRQVFNDDCEPLSMLMVSHAPQGGKVIPVWKNKLGEESQVSPEDIEVLVHETMSAVNDDASGMGGVQRYIITAHIGAKQVGRCAIRVEGHDEAYDDVGDSEPANSRGLVAQQMRHNEVLMKSFGQTISGTIQMLVRQNAKQADQIEGLLNHRLRMFETVEEARSKKHERELEMAALQYDEDRKDKLIEKAGLLLPAVANKLAGQKLLNEPMSVRDIALKDLVESLEPERFQAMLGQLAPEQQILLLQLLQHYQTKDDEPSNGVKE